MSRIDYAAFHAALHDGFADERMELVETVTVEDLLEQQGDSRRWNQLDYTERRQILPMMKAYATEHGYRLDLAARCCTLHRT